MYGPFTSEQFERIRRLVARAAETVLGEKQAQYSPGEDRMEDFHQAAYFRHRDPSDVVGGYLFKHYQALENIIEMPASERPPLLLQLPSGAEGPLSRIVDVRNYLDFLAAALVEEFLAKHPEETFESYVSRLEAALDDASGGAAEERKEKVHRAK